MYKRREFLDICMMKVLVFERSFLYAVLMGIIYKQHCGY